MKKGLVSCLLCTYNAEAFIDATLFSVTNQIYESLEILIRDDGSKDGTLQKLQQWRKKDKRIQIFFESWVKRWSYGWLNFLLEKAQWEFVAIQDHDDLWHKDKIRQQVDYLDCHSEFVWCGTKTLMWYEADQKGFEYYLWKHTTQTLHPSLMFRNDGEIRYPHQIYMNDALFQKKVLCKWKKLIYNIDKILTFHRICADNQNYSYRWFRFTKKNLQVLFYLHPMWYACCALGVECFRKLMYPLLVNVKLGKWIDRIERLPFVLLGNKIGKFRKKNLEEIGFYSVW